MDTPDPTNVEISLFGNGNGECTAIHVGDGKWILVDSCISEAADSVPLHIEYLQQIGVDPARQVEFVVATHWHDDHVRGLSDTFRRCLRANIVVPSALNSDEFAALVDRFGDMYVGLFKSGVSEFAQISQVVSERRKSDSDYQGLVYGTINKRILRLVVHGCGAFAEATTLSPSDLDHTCSLHILADYLQCRDTIPSPDRNHSSIVLLLTIGTRSILLGGDKEVSTDVNMGWAIIDKAYSDYNYSRSTAYKVSHHGSPNGDCPQIWQNMLDEEPVAALTSFKRGRTKRPSKADVERILGKTPHAFITSDPTLKKTPLSADAKKLLRDMRGKAAHIERLYSRAGHIRLRGSFLDNNQWEVRLSGHAKHLKNV
jgi:phosphoribosyl 1,2-cyclic phosphodiesterase